MATLPNVTRAQSERPGTSRPNNPIIGGLRRIFGTQEAILALSLITLMLIVGAINPRLYTPGNLSNIFQGNAYIAVAALGMTMVIISGNIDISVGYLLGGLMLLCGTVATSGYPVWFAWLVPLIVGGLVGAVHGVLVAYLRLPSIVVTLGTLSIFKGGLVLIFESKTIYDLPEGFGLSKLSPLGVPMPVWIMIILTILVAIWMRYSTFARAIYAVGGNREAARLSGINVRRVTLIVFIINGVFVGIASVLLATQFTTIQATPPQGAELVIITSAVVGGVSILGGTGTVIGSTIAAILLSAIRTGMILVNISAYWLQAVQGLLILATVFVDVLRRQRQRRAARE